MATNQAATRESVGDPNAAPPFVSLSTVRSYYGAVRWAWPAWLPIGHVTLIAGPQGVGKSYLAAHLIAALTGHVESWPNGTSLADARGPVMLLDTEAMRGSYAERLAPYDVGDEDLVFPSPDGDPAYTPRLPDDMAMIEQIAGQLKAQAVILDSLSGGHSLDENGAEMRAILRPLVALAGRRQIAVLVVHHANKRSQFETARLTLDRVRGSSTISQF